MLEKQREHLSKLQKQSKIEEFVVKTLYIIFFVAYNLFEIYLVYLIGKYSNKVYETISILFFFLINKAMFGKPLHFKSSLICLGVSLVTFYTAINLAFNFNISILSSVIIGVFSGAITSYIASYVYNENKKMTNREKIIAKLNGNTSQEYIFEYCRNNGFKEYMADTIDLFLNNTLEETSQILEKDIRTIQERINNFIKSS